MKLGTNKEWMVRNLNRLHQLPIWRNAGEDHPRLLKSLPVTVVELIPMAMAFANYTSPAVGL